MSGWWSDGRERSKQAGGREMEDEAFVCCEGRQNWTPEGDCCSYSLGKGELHCPPIETTANSKANGPMPSSFEKTDHCMSR